MSDYDTKQLNQGLAEKLDALLIFLHSMIKRNASLYTRNLKQRLNQLMLYVQSIWNVKPPLAMVEASF